MKNYENRKKAPEPDGKKILTLKTGHVILILAVITVVFFSKILLQKAFFWDDFVNIFYINRQFAAVNLANGIIPLWNPYIFSGLPFIGEVFYPFHLLLTFFVSKGELNYVYLEYLIIIHYFLAGLFTYLFCKAIRLSALSSLYGGIAFMLSGFIVCHLIHETAITTITWLPLVMMLYVKLFENKKWSTVFLLSIFYGLLVLGGHPQIILYASFFLLLFCLFYFWNSFKEVKYKINSEISLLAVKIIIPAILGIMIGSIQLLPSIELSEISVRSEMSYEESLDGSISYSDLITLIAPKFYGSSEAENMNPQITGKKETKYWWKEYNYWETCFYVGIATLFLGLFGICSYRKNKIVIFLSMMSLFSILMMLGDNFFLYKLFYNYIPGFNKFRVIGRIGLIFDFAFPVLAAFGIEALLHPKKNNLFKYFIIYSGIFFGVIIIFWILLVSQQLKGLTPFYNQEDLYFNSAKQIGVSLIFLFLVILLFLSIYKKFIKREIAIVILILTGVIDLFLFGINQNNDRISPTEKFQNRDIAKLIKKEYNSGLFRINNNASSINYNEKNQGMLDGIFFTEGNNPLQLQRKSPPAYENELLNVKYIIFPEKIGSVPVYRNPNLMPRVWMSFKPVIISDIDSGTITMMKSPQFDYRRMAVLNEDPGIVISDTSECQYKCIITNYETNKIVISVETPKPGILILSEVYHKYWKAYVDGVEKKILLADYCLRGIGIENGKHTVVFEYSPDDFKLGALLCLVSMVIICAGLFFSFRYKK